MPQALQARPRAADLVLGSDVADAILDMEKVQKLLDRNSGIIIGTIDQELSRYDAWSIWVRLISAASS